MNARSRTGACAAALLGLLAFWVGLWMASTRYSSPFDWPFMTISNLVYPNRDPAGFRWAWGGVVLCASGGLCWMTILLREWREENDGPPPLGIWALTLGYVCMVFCAVLPERIGIPRIHETLAILAFLGQCTGIVQVTLLAAENFLSGKGHSAGKSRALAIVLASAALSPVLLAGATPLYVSYTLPQLPWVGPEWRARGVPGYLSFAFWEWISCAVLSVYTAALCLATKSIIGRRPGLAVGYREANRPAQHAPPRQNFW